VGETTLGNLYIFITTNLSVSSNGSTWVKQLHPQAEPTSQCLSVSSNGSTWVKLESGRLTASREIAFSILERIDVGETQYAR